MIEEIVKKYGKRKFGKIEFTKRPKLLPKKEILCFRVYFWGFNLVLSKFLKNGSKGARV